MARSAAVVLAVVLALAACDHDEPDTPDVTDARPLGSITAAPATTAAASTSTAGDAPVCDGSAPDASDVAACAASSGPPPASTTPASLPRCEDPDDATDPDEAPCAP